MPGRAAIRDSAPAGARAFPAPGGRVQAWPARPGSRRWGFAGVLGWVLLGFVALPAVPQAAHAQAVKEIWSGTLTTGSTTTSPTLFGFGTDTPGGSLGTVADRTIPELQGGGARYVTVLINDNASGGTLRLS